MQQLRRRRQRPFRPPEGVSYYKQIEHFGLVYLQGWQPCNCLCTPEATCFQESRMSGNLLVRFDEGRVRRTFVLTLSPNLPPPRQALCGLRLPVILRRDAAQVAPHGVAGFHHVLGQRAGFQGGQILL